MTNSQFIKHKYLWGIFTLFIIDCLFFGKTNASNVPPILLIIGFMLVVCTSYVLIYGLCGLMKLYGIPIKHKNRLSLFGSLTFGLILALQSVGELSVRDIIVLVPLAFIGYLYAIYASSHRRNLDA